MPRPSRRLHRTVYRRPDPAVVAWATTMPHAMPCTAAALYPHFAASSPAKRSKSRWSCITLGIELARMMGNGVVANGSRGTWTFVPRRHQLAVTLPWA